MFLVNISSILKRKDMCFCKKITGLRSFGAFSDITFLVLAFLVII